MVGVTGFEPTTSWSRTKRATNCATPRKLYFVFIKFFTRISCVYGSARGASSLGIKPRGLWLQTVHRTLCLTRRPNCATPRKLCSVFIKFLLNPIKPHQVKNYRQKSRELCTLFYRRYLLYNFIYKKARFYTTFFIKFYAFSFKSQLLTIYSVDAIVSLKLSPLNTTR